MATEKNDVSELYFFIYTILAIKILLLLFPMLISYVYCS